MSTASKQLFIRMVLDQWNTYNSRISKLLDTLSEEQLMNETAPGRNRGLYLLGHLIAVNDNLFPLLGLGEKMYPELASIFVDNPDRSFNEYPPLSILKENWKKINEKLTDRFARVTEDEWFQKHNAVSAEDFQREPHRNKLNVIINRTNHTSSHYGQLLYLVKK